MLFGTVVVVLLGTVVVVVLLGTVVVVLLGTVVVVVSAPLGVVVLVVAGEDGGEVVLVVSLDAVAVVVVVVDVAAEPSPVAGRVVVLELDTDDAGCDPLDVDPTFAGDDEVPGDDVDAVDVVVVVLDAAVPLDPLAAFPTDPSVTNCDTGVPDVPDVPTACSDVAICAGTGGCDDTCVAPTATAPAKPSRLRRCERRRRLLARAWGRYPRRAVSAVRPGNGPRRCRRLLLCRRR